jgi:undecaprenyl-diphosphatase
MDKLMLAASDALWWLPFFAWLLFVLYKSYPGKSFLWVVLAIIVSITLTDRLSVMAFKDVFMRYRPCHNMEIMDKIHLVKEYCGGQYGFVSSHAANYAGLGTLFYGLLRFQFPRSYLIFILWVFIIGYSRIYIGVHYPLDVLGGWILGWIIGSIVLKAVNIPLNKSI